MESVPPSQPEPRADFECKQGYYRSNYQHRFEVHVRYRIPQLIHESDHTTGNHSSPYIPGNFLIPPVNLRMNSHSPVINFEAHLPTDANPWLRLEHVFLPLEVCRA